MNEKFIDKIIETYGTKCDDYCWLSRWGRCSTKNKDGICDHLERRKEAIETNGGETGFEW